MSSDILVLLKAEPEEAEAEAISAAIYGATRSAIVTWSPTSARTLLVRFDPIEDSPEAILAAVRGAGHAAVIAGG